MAVFGSPAAVKALASAGEYDYANFAEQLEKLKKAAQYQSEKQWLSRFYTGWLYSFFPQVQAKDRSFPPYMRSEAWSFKEMNTALGSWAELKHDTALYGKMPEFMGGGGPPSSGPPPSYVEPNPEVFFRLAYITNELALGMMFRVSQELVSSNGVNYTYVLEALGKQFQQLGKIAVKELSGQPLTEEDFQTIQQCMGPVECVPDAFPDVPPIPVVAAVAGAENDVLEAGVGHLDRIYVVVPINGQLQVAQGGVFSYYEFTQPRSDRLTDETWQKMLAADTPARPIWTEKFLHRGGAPTNVLAFRTGDWYIITAEGGKPPLNVRAEPSRNAAVILRLEQGTYINLIDSPVILGDETWWKISQDFGGVEGWVLENPAWYMRAYGQ
jgi:hypothetical protein